MGDDGPGGAGKLQPECAWGLTRHLSRLADARIWIEALVQNAWDTGAGWGLVLCYAAYLREREDTALNAFILPMANNCISLLAAIMVFCTVFSVVPQLMEKTVQNTMMAASSDMQLFAIGRIKALRAVSSRSRK